MSVRLNRSGNWQIRFEENGVPYSKTVKTKDFPSKRAAEKEEARWLTEIRGRAARPGFMSMLEAMENLIADLKLNKKYEYARYCQKKVDLYLGPMIGALDANQFDLQNWKTYERKRNAMPSHMNERTQPATINRERAIVVSALLALPTPRILGGKKLDESSGKRRGTFTPNDYARFMAILPDFMKPILCFSYYVGIRAKEVRSLRREWTAGWEVRNTFRVPGYYNGERITKKGTDRTLRLLNPQMREYLRWALDNGNPKCPFLFQKDGKPVTKSMMRCAWDKAREDLGLPRALFHDNRRTAATNLVRSGFDKRTAMGVTDHLTESVFDGYDQRAEDETLNQEIEERLLRLEQRWLEAQKKNIEPKVGEKLATDSAAANWKQ